MNIGIIGLGVLGTAYKSGFLKWGHNVLTYDIKGKYWDVSTKNTIISEIGQGYMTKPLQKPHPKLSHNEETSDE